MYSRIVVALDGSELAERVLPYVEALAARFGSTIVLLHATTPPEAFIVPPVAGVPVADFPAIGRVSPEVAEDFESIGEAEREETASYLDRVASDLRSGGLEVLTEAVEGNAADVILDRAVVDGADLIALTTHGRGGLARLVLGSTADDVVRSAPCPVLLVRVQEEAEET